MEDIASLWTYQENIEDLKQKLLYTSLELEEVKSQANEEMKRNKEYVKQLIQFLKMAVQERDEARDQLHKLLNKLMIPSAATIPSNEILSTIPQVPPENMAKPTRANSSITESNSFSDQAYNYHSQNSSPVESLFDAVTSPDLSNSKNPIYDSTNNMAFMNQPYVQDYNGTIPSHVPTGVPKVDQASLIIDSLVKGKTLPQKGNLLQSVLEAGPLIQTLLVAGPLPRWRNPPPLQSFHIPPVSILGSDFEYVGIKLSENSSHGLTLMNSKSYVEKSCASSQMMSTSMMNFGNPGSSSLVGNGKLMISACANSNNLIPSKKQRFHYGADYIGCGD